MIYIMGCIRKRRCFVFIQLLAFTAQSNGANMGKGEDFERQISKQLSLWWTGGERDDVFWRTSQSGGRATQRAKSDLKTAYSYGDITFIDPIGKPFCDLLVLEAKRGYTNTSRKIKAADMDKLCDGIDYAHVTHKQIKNNVQTLFSKTKKGGGVDLLDFVDDNRPVDKLPLHIWIAKAELDRAQAGAPYFWLIGRRDSKQEFVLMPYDLMDLIEFHTDSRLTAASNITLDVAGGGKYYMTTLSGLLEWLDPDFIRKAASLNKTRRFKP